MILRFSSVGNWNTKNSLDPLLRRIIALVLVTCTLGLAAGSARIGICAERPSVPNIIFILADDLGCADVGCNGSKFYETPHIDRLARQGMRFTDAYAACPVCSPTRASILTGKWPARLHLTDWIPGEGNSPAHRLLVPKWRQYLPLEEMNLAKALKPAGYVSASVGKWHLGGPEYYPQRQGFDLNIAGTHYGHPASYFWPYEGKTHTVAGLREGGHQGEYLTDRLTAEAEKFIEQNKDHPFFLYLPHYAVHGPLQGKPAVVAKYKAKKPVAEQKNAVYAAMVEGVDDSVGRILAKLDALGIADRTVVVFFSDNGGVWPQATSNAPLRAGKGFLYEGGIREPMIVKWPGKVRPGSTCSVPVASVDFFPTFLQIAGVKLPGKVDGESLVPLFEQSGPLHRDALYWHYPHYWGGNRVRPAGAVRWGDWKLIEHYEDNRVELYNLKDDLSETRDLAAEKPDEAARLRTMLHDWRRSVDAQMPRPNPNYGPAKAQGNRLANDRAQPANTWN
jgi:arylsulfatase A